MCFSLNFLAKPLLKSLIWHWFTSFYYLSFRFTRFFAKIIWLLVMKIVFNIRYWVLCLKIQVWLTIQKWNTVYNYRNYEVFYVKIVFLKFFSVIIDKTLVVCVVYTKSHNNWNHFKLELNFLFNWFEDSLHEKWISSELLNTIQ